MNDETELLPEEDSSFWRQKTLSVSNERWNQLERIQDYFQFKRNDEAYKYCFAVGVRLGMADDADLIKQTPPNPRKTKYQINSLDDSGNIEEFLRCMNLVALDADIKPIAVLENIAERSIGEIHDNIVEAAVTVNVTEVVGHLESIL